MKTRVLGILLLLTALLTACVYDFTPDYNGEGGLMVIEGDILIGEVCQFNFAYSQPLNPTSSEAASVPMVSSLRVEASDGTVYPGVGTRVDLTGADPSHAELEYRMVATVRVQGGAVKTYASAWSPVSFAAPIDSLSWSVNDDRTEMSINVSTHTDGKQGYHRWLAEETWEYRAEYYALYFYARKGTVYRGVELPKDSVYRYEGGDNTYYCWNSAQRPEVMAASTTDLSEDRLVNHRLYTLGNKERKISYLYSVEVKQMRMTEEGYRYWETVQKNTYDVGGLFSPEPSELRGNIACEENPDELVLGYVNVSTVSKQRLFVDNWVAKFGIWRGESHEALVPPQKDWLKTFRDGYRVVDEHFNDATGEPDGLYNWQPLRCVDCRYYGGTKNKPAYWPNKDI